MIDNETTPRLDVHSLCKLFGDVVANNALSLRVHAGEIVVLLGENGAGKTTLLRCLAGMLQPDAGVIRVDGQEQQFNKPADALRAGIGIVYQHFALVPTFTVEEQLRLAGWRPGASLGPSDIGVDPTATIASLPLGARQRVEVARALPSARRVLLLDEPTAVLAPLEVEALFVTLRELRATGLAIVLITHKLREALAIGDRIIVLRNGRVAGERRRPAAGWPSHIEAELLSLMFGSSTSAAIVDVHVDAEMPETTPLLRVEALAVSHDSASLRDVSFALFPGEVVAVAGIDGNGQRELAEALTGFLAPTGGTISVAGRQLGGRGPAAARAAGVTLLTDDRLGEGAVPERSLAENLALTRLTEPVFVRRGFLRRRAMRRDAARQIARFAVRPSDPAILVAALSGGNLQKLQLARALATGPRVLVCLKPTTGLDARTADAVRAALRAYARDGHAVLIFSNELDEVLATGDRVGAMFRGQLSPLVPRDATSAESLGRFMVGAT